MKVYLNRCCKVVIFASMVAGMIMAPTNAWADGHKPNILPPKAKAYGASYRDWSARWWQWILSIPVTQSPSKDQNGDCNNGAVGQAGPVWFLTGVINESGVAVRNCEVPSGKALFFPIINVECSTLEAAPFHGNTESELRVCAKGFRIADVSAQIDGRDVEDIQRYLVESPRFDFSVPQDNILGVPAGSGKSVSNGYYLLLAPLSPGQHNIHFSGSFPDFPFALDITYHLTVTRR